MNSLVFSDRDYTRDALIKQAGLIELHCKDGSAIDAGCMCIDTKHLFLMEGLSEEGQGFALSTKERKFYEHLADLVRLIRKRMEVEDYDLHGAMREVMKKDYPSPLHVGNPRGRDFLPHGLTVCEQENPDVRRKLKACIKETELKCCGKHTRDYSMCTCNPVAVCRASIPCPS